MKRQDEIESKIRSIINKYNSDTNLIVSKAYLDGGSNGLLGPRLERAATNQLCDGAATVSRYAIWANTVRDIIIEAGERLKNDDDKQKIMPLIIKAANSLSAFSDIQALFDKMEIGEIES